MRFWQENDDDDDDKQVNCALKDNNVIMNCH